MASNLLFPGGDVLESFLQNMADKIIAMVDEILTEKADAMIYDIMQPKIEESLKAIFSSSPVQLEAAKMFNKEIFPIYDRSLKDFASAKQLIDGAAGAAKVAFDKYTTAVVEAGKKGGDAASIEKAKKTFKEDMQKINDEQVKYNGEGGGKLQEFLLNKENMFKKLEDGATLEPYLTDPGAPVMDAMSEIINKTEATYNELKKNIEEADKTQKELEERRISKFRIPGISACPAIKSMYKNEKSKITETIKENDKKNEEDKDTDTDKSKPSDLITNMKNPTEMLNKLTNRIGGRKSIKKSRKRRKRTNKKRKTV